MKLRTWMALSLLFVISTAYANTYYWYKNEKIFLESGNMFYVACLGKSNIETNSFMLTKREILSNGNIIEYGIVSEKQIHEISDILYKTQSFHIAEDTTNIFVTENFYVKLKNDNDYVSLVEYATQYNIEFVRQGPLSRWYTLRCTPSSRYNALELANIFYESGLFDAAEPEFINSTKITCDNDPYFHEQWNLLNTGQYDTSYSGVDINFCEAFDITQGDESVIIAIIDNGVELTHPDLHIYPLSFDAHSLTSPSQIYTVHGTECAGIIGAYCNNNLGISGIAPDCPLMSISFKNVTSPENIARGINFARQNGASVLSNSWSRITPSDIINEAIDSALCNGRNGKGCIVIFATGNDDGAVSYPANYNSDIIAVGAISPCAERKSKWYSCDGNWSWGSNYGNTLDIMAPGVFIPTTDLTGTSGASSSGDTLDYYMRFAGTSAACPHVAAVAGLMLSVNPELTQKEVAYFIMKSAQKIGDYDYENTNTSEHPYGSWNVEMGYGLVDAYGSVMLALDKYIQDTLYSTTSVLVETPNNIYAGKNVILCNPQGDVIIASGSNVHYKAGNSIHFEPGFRVNSGARFYAEIANVVLPNSILERRVENCSINEDSSSKISIDALDKTPSASKILLNGQVFIKQGDRVYNTDGILVY